jgi:tetratricopeptide (TPR) repeat protein
MQPPQASYQSRELQWQLDTKAGNQQMQVNLYFEAQQYYERALELACLLLEEAKNSSIRPDTIHLYVISCHNLADSWLNLGKMQQAEMVLQQGFDQVIQTMNDVSLSNKLRLEAFKALKMVSFEMDSFYRQQNQVARAEQIFERAITLARDFLAQFNRSHTFELEELQKLGLF